MSFNRPSENRARLPELAEMLRHSRARACTLAEDLVTDLLPEDETIDDLLTAIKTWRTEEEPEQP